MLRKHQIPNLLTGLRYICVPLLVAAFYLPAPWGLWLPLSIMIKASISDFLDGYLARRWNVQSELGRMLDPNADKLLIAAGLVMLALHGLAHPAAVILILSRELFVSGLRETMAAKNITLHVTKLAKWKTTLQMASVIVLLYAYACGCGVTALFGGALLWIAALLTLYTGWDYWRKALPHLRG